jgi:glyoxalase-like protein
MNERTMKQCERSGAEPGKGVSCLGAASQMLTRRSALTLLVAAGVPPFWRSSMVASQAMRPAADAVDHLLLGTRDLEAGIDWVAKRFGVRAAVGGSHPGRGSRNALIAFRQRRYLEIIAPDPAQPPENLTRNLRTLDEPRLIGWASASADLGTLARRLQERGQRVAGPLDGARIRPDGGKLAWRTIALEAKFEQDGTDPIPFFIQWSPASSHPSQDSPQGSDLIAFAIEHPKADAVRALLAQSGIDAEVRQAKSCRLIATLDTPNGRVVLT